MTSFSGVVSALVGPHKARASHKRGLSRPRTLAAGIEAAQSLCPGVASRSTDDPLFILSAGWRSGSTFLQRIVIASDRRLMWGEPFGRAALIDHVAAPLRAFNDEWPKAKVILDSTPSDDLSGQWVANLYPPIQDFLDSQVALFDTMFAQPARRMHWPTWGIKEVRLSTDHAVYLRWLFPQAKFLFLCRNPFDAYRSYRPYRSWYWAWPEHPVLTPWRFGRVWAMLAGDFLDGHSAVDGLLVRYEDIAKGAARRDMEEYLGHPVVEPNSLARVGSANSGRPAPMTLLERVILAAAVRPVAAKLGYGPDGRRK